MRKEVMEQMEREEQIVFELGETLKALKLEAANFESLSRQLRNEEAMADAECFKLQEEAEKAEILANHTKSEIKQLEKEIGNRM